MSDRPGRRRRPAGVSAEPGSVSGRLAIARDIDANDTGSPPAATKAMGAKIVDIAEMDLVLAHLHVPEAV